MEPPPGLLERKTAAFSIPSLYPDFYPKSARSTTAARPTPAV
jgi:hypothetical protein